MGVKKCPFCGKDLPSESKFCPYCMERINEPVAVSVPDEVKSNKKFITVVILVFIILLTVGIALFAHYKNAQNDENVNNDISMEETNDVDDINSNEGDTTDGILVDLPNVDNVNANKPNTEKIDTKEELKTTNTNEASTNVTNANKETTTTSTNVIVQCEHVWIKQTKTVRHDEVGHYETVQRQRPITQYKCPVCYKTFASLDTYYSHFDSTHKPGYSGDPITMLRNQYTTETGYEYYDVQEWVVDREAYDETVVTGYKCKFCGKEKSN